ncbi:MAG: hypothetical protein LUF78_03500 [Clostridiales bacterium]|nr:hypothetical protein [Clostridiales bacterium]
MNNFQERLLKDFDVKQERQKNGRIKNVYVYKGEYASWGKKGEELKRYKRIHLGGGILMIFLTLWAALQSIPMNASKLVGCVTLVSVVALMVLAMGIVSFVSSKERMYLRDCKQIRDRIFWSAMICFLLQLMDVILGIVYIIRNGATLLSLLVVLAWLVSAALSMGIFLTQKKLGYEVVA